MSNDFLIWTSYWLGLWIIYRTYIGIKAKAWNEGYKRGRASINVREIVK